MVLALVVLVTAMTFPLTGLGITGIALALAAQETLSNALARSPF